MSKNHKDEHVLVFPSNLLKNIGYFQGLSFEINKYLNVIKPKYSSLPRSEAEENPEYKQLISYAILRHGKKIFSYKRGKLLSEKRLFDNYSIGVGGHILGNNDRDLFEEEQTKGVEREIREEIFIGTNYQSRHVALLNDDSNEIGKVHFGLIYLFDLDEANVKKKEKSINEQTFFTVQELKKNIRRYENWSRICIDNIERLTD
uniref:Predicted phosphoesterase, NUDIX family n=1 Tax=Candidatus Kentrum sp. SD TaxID=2126332 RepID=A0A451BQT0_9GAMM|nr:MAG: Predicted phosphoesterase, NUDIX family [Candidatus Kentron sp. SD]VFK43458.1 MAG: Predicted phosphoesterase, NUDIX family [Candidatus Kentron sp. SD]VFK80634.1 MAG: Predicted phosphoesterase, NUDIX family [Candidatus Kentron sp. SD]